MNNEPVAWMREDGVIAFHKQKEVDSQGYKWIPLYTHPVKEWNKAKDRFPNYETICLQCGTTIYKPFKELTDEEINKLWAESHEDGIAMQQGFTTQQHYFAHLILRKAQEK